MEQSPLARLPPELRNMIYELVLLSPEPLSIQKTLVASEKKRIYLSISETGSVQRPQTQLLRTCKAVYGDTSRLLYAINTFYFPSFDAKDHTGLRRFDIFVAEIGKGNASALRNVVVAHTHYACWRDIEHTYQLWQALSGAVAKAKLFPKSQISVEASVSSSSRPASGPPRWRYKKVVLRFNVRNLELSFEMCLGILGDGAAFRPKKEILKEVRKRVMDGEAPGTNDTRDGDPWFRHP